MKIILIGLLFLVAGCTQFQSAVNNYGSSAARNALTAAEWTVCVASPVGAIKARYKDKKQLLAWANYCKAVQSTPSLELINE